jgi:hypothetical protein
MGYTKAINLGDRTQAAIDFLNKRMVIRENGCHEWTGSVNDGGYGITTFDYHTYIVHRLSYAAHHQGILEETDGDGQSMVVRHLCHNPRCFNNAHLALGTQTDNMGDKHDAGTHMYGSNHPSAKINEEIAKKIYDLRDTMTQSARAEMFDVTIATVASIDIKRKWRSIHPEDELPPKKQNIKTEVEWTLENINEAYEKMLTCCEEAVEVDPLVGTKCLIWKKNAPLWNDRGAVHIFNDRFYAQTIACMYNEKRPCPKGLVVCQTCTNRELCYEPTHLRFDTHKQVAWQKIQSGKRKTKLTIDQVNEIRKIYAAGGVTPIMLTGKYGVTRSTISNIVHRRIWKNI